MKDWNKIGSKEWVLVYNSMEGVLENEQPGMGM